MANKYLKIIIYFILLAVAFIFIWMYLPEKIYEIWGRLFKINFILEDIAEIEKQKKTTIFLIAFGLSLFLDKKFLIFVSSISKILSSFLFVFASYVIGILICISIFQYKRDTVKYVSYSDSLNVFIVLPIMLLLISGFIYLSKKMKK